MELAYLHMQSVANLAKNVLDYTVKEAINAGKLEQALDYLWSCIGSFASVIHSPVDQGVQFNAFEYFEKAMEAAKTTKAKLLAARAAIPKMKNEVTGYTNVKVDEECAELYGRIAEKYRQKAEGDAFRYLIQTVINAHIVECEIKKQLIQKIQANPSMSATDHATIQRYAKNITDITTLYIFLAQIYHYINHNLIAARAAKN